MKLPPPCSSLLSLSCGLLVLLLLFLSLTACPGAGADRPAAQEARPQEGLQVHRGDFSRRVLLTGELYAAQAHNILVPRTRLWQIQIRWMEADGAEVVQGQKILEFDNSAVVGELQEKRLEAVRAANELARLQADLATQEAEKLYRVEERRIALAKAQIEAAVPEELLSRREFQDKQLALEKAQTEHAKAVRELESFRRGMEADLAVRRIQLEKARREIEAAERAIQELTVRAPWDGILVVAEHPWEGRKIQVGDTVWVGLTVFRLPDLSSLQVRARLSDVDDGEIAPGLSGTCTLDTYPDLPFPCHVVDITPVAQEPGRGSQRRVFQVLVALDRVDVERMRPGMSVKVEVETSHRKDVLLAPRAGLDLSSHPPRALLAQGGAVEVALGPCSAATCVVEQGLEEGVRLHPVNGSGEKG